MSDEKKVRLIKYDTKVDTIVDIKLNIYKICLKEYL